MTSDPNRPRPFRRWRVWLAAATAIVAVMAVGVVLVIAGRRAQLQQRLLRTPPSDVLNHLDLVRFATAEAKPLFARNCASCHGADMKGRTDIGAPDLTDHVWLYGDDGVFEIERTILYGIRSGASKTRDITEMPAYGQRGQLSNEEISNLVQYLLQLSHRPNDPLAAGQGQALYSGKGGCFDCHAADAKGDADYGAPDLTANAWSFGGSPAQLHDSIYYGRHGVMPAWFGKLTLEQIRALAVYVHAASQR